MKHALLLSALLCLLLLPAPAAGEDFVVGIPDMNGSGPQLPEAEALFREAYGRIGVRVQFEYLPMLREYSEATLRRIDASAGRTPAAAQGSPDLVLIETPLLRTTVVAYSRKPLAGLHTWDDLLSLKLGYLRGDLTTLHHLARRHPDAYGFSSLQDGFSALQKERLDVFVTHTTFVRLSGMDDAAKRFASSPPLYDGFFHHALNRRHAHLAQGLSDAFGAMIEDGTSERLMGRFRDLLPDPSAR